MTDNTDTLIAHVMVACPMNSSMVERTSVNGTCRPCEYCAGFVIDPNNKHISRTRKIIN